MARSDTKTALTSQIDVRRTKSTKRSPHKPRRRRPKPYRGQGRP
jgi:hypothetical protein